MTKGFPHYGTTRARYSTPASGHLVDADEMAWAGRFLLLTCSEIGNPACRARNTETTQAQDISTDAARAKAHREGKS